ncbi:MAG TPA: hypothetical protein VFY48_02800 [Solirubrobacterales bacterium]|nr:hypothetical protein [Solirubrobacterales bacterium]
MAAALGALGIAALVFAGPGVSAVAPGSADLRIAKIDSPDPVTAGSTLTYSLEVENLGPNAATGVTVVDQLPQGVDLVSAAVPGGQCSTKGRKVTCSLGDVPVANGAYATARTVSVVVVPRRVGTIVNTASVKGAEKDPVKANDKATATTRVVGPARTCRGVPATVAGTRGDDVLVGSGGPDVIVSFGGNDTIYAFGGRDLVCAGSGGDRIGGGTAFDRLFGGAGGDRLLGRGGPDLLKGGPGRDLLRGNRGTDRLRGGPGSDRCQGGPGRDSLRGCER